MRSPCSFPVLLGLAILLGSCTPSRSVQCQRLSEIARTVQESAQPAVSGRSAAITRAATGFTTAIEQLNSIGHLDDDLAALQGVLREVYGNSGEATNQFLAALEDRDRAQATQAVQRLEALAQDEKDALEQLNLKCYPEAEEGDAGVSPEPTATPAS